MDYSYGGPGFLAVVGVGSFPLLSPHPPQQVVYLYLSSFVSPVELTDGIFEREGRGKEPNHTMARKPGPL
jgi:hypothetical protein